MDYNRKLILEDGQEYYGYGFGAQCDKVCEIVFNTSMVGYQEIISDPSYTYQAVVMTYPLIGNYGMADDDYETKIPTIGALVVREYNDEPSNFRCSKTLSQVMKEYNIPGICGVDTRKINRSIRDLGSRKALITGIDTQKEWGMKMLEQTKIPTDAVMKVSCKEPWLSRTEHERFTVVAIDCGMKMNIVRSLNKRGCKVIIVPWDTPAAEIEKFKPDGVFISNGRPDGRSPGNSDDKGSARKVRYFRHLPGTPDNLAGVRCENVQAEIRSPRRKSPGKKPCNGKDRDNLAEPLVCGGYGKSEGHRPYCDTHKSA